MSEEPRISACLIVRDEEQLLGACLSSLRGFVDELCVVDTGSTDRTLAIAAEHGARIGHFAWCDDFSAARNASLDLATGDWVLVIDADETLVAETGPALRAAVRTATGAACFVTLENISDEDQGAPRQAVQRQRALLPRLFRKHAGIRFARRVHESVLESLHAAGFEAPAQSEVRIEHVGYQAARLETHDKYARNAKLLMLEAEQSPDDLYTHYKLALSLRRLDREPEALEAFEHAMELIEGLDPAVRREYPCAALVAAGLLELRAQRGELDEAAVCAERARACALQAPELWAAQGELALGRGLSATADKDFERALTDRGQDRLRAVDPAALLRRAHLGRVQAALMDTEAGGTADIDARLCAARAALGPGALAAVESAAIRVLFARGEVERGLAALAELFESSPTDPDVGLLGGELAWLQGEPDTARDTWRRVADASIAGQNARARLALAELAAAEFESAAETLTELRAVDLQTTATRVIGALALGLEPRLASCLEPERVLAVLGQQLGELLEAGGEAAVERFAQAAAAHATLLSGIDRLIVRDGD